MDFEKYISLTKRTCNNNLEIEDKIKNYEICLFEEVGEVTGILKKEWYHSHTLDNEKLSKEFGDVLWYISRLFDIRMYDIEDRCHNQYDDKYGTLRGLMREVGNYITYPDQETLSFIYWYTVFLIEMHDMKVEDVCKQNIDKLIERFPEKFTYDASKKRVDVK